MEEELKKPEMQPQNVAPKEEKEKVDVIAIIKEMKAKNVEDDEILNAIEQMVKEGKLDEEDYKKASEYLENSEKEEVKSFFGLPNMFAK